MNWNGRLRQFFTISIALATSATLLLAARTARGNPPQGMGGDASTEQAVKDFDQKWLHAASTHDGDTLQQIFADGMFEVQKGGVVVTGAEMRKTLTAPGRNI